LWPELRSLALKNGVRFQHRSFIFNNLLASLVLDTIFFSWWRGVFAGAHLVFSALPVECRLQIVDC
jgi:hypothetical protein